MTNIHRPIFIEVDQIVDLTNSDKIHTRKLLIDVYEISRIKEIIYNKSTYGCEITLKNGKVVYDVYENFINLKNRLKIESLIISTN